MLPGADIEDLKHEYMPPSKGSLAYVQRLFVRSFIH